MAALLDRIAEAEGLCDKFSGLTARAWAEAHQRREKELERAHEKVCAERRAREAAEADRNSADADLEAVRNQFKQAFRAATGQDYEPGRDYTLTENSIWLQGHKAAEERTKELERGFEKATGVGYYSWKYRDLQPGSVPEPKKLNRKEYPTVTPVKQKDLKPGDEVVVNGSHVKAIWVVNDDLKTAYHSGRYTDDQPDVPEAKDALITLANHTLLLVSKGGTTVSKEKRRFHRTRRVGFWSVMFIVMNLIGSVLPMPQITMADVKAWWEAPTPLHLGDFVEVTTCDRCGRTLTARERLMLKANPDSVFCRGCAGEEFTTERVQQLFEHTWARTDEEDRTESVRGFMRANGERSLVEGNWHVPGIDVEVVEK